jgi:putative FmdB family regulatory protein
MPTYEYICSKCHHRFETVQSIKARALKVCPKELCPQKPWGKGEVKRVIGAGGGLIFKGSGFYTTDYRSENYKAAAKKDAGPSSEGAKKESKTPAPGASSASATPASTPPTTPAPPKKD